MQNVIRLQTHKYSKKWKPQMQIRNTITNKQIQQQMGALIAIMYQIQLQTHKYSNK